MSNGQVPIVCEAVAVVILRCRQDQVQVLLMRRVHQPHGVWCQVAGGIEAGETAWQTALREVKEETGLILSEIWTADFCEQFYEPAKNRIAMLPVFVGVVPPEAEVVLNAEHDAYRWVSCQEADQLFDFQGQRTMPAAVMAAFIDRTRSRLSKIDII